MLKIGLVAVLLALIPFPTQVVPALSMGPVWNVVTYLQHAGLGPHSQIIARYQQKQGDVVYRPGKPVSNRLIIKPWD